MSGIMSMLLGAVSSVAVAVDEFFNRVTLLLPGNGTNGAQNNTFLDSSSNNFTITRNGNTTQGTFSPFSQTGWSNYFLNTGSQNLSAVTGADTSPGTGDFCAELWYWSTTTSGNYGLFGNLESNTDTQWGILLIQGSSLVRFQGWNTTFVSGTEPARNAWNHVAVCRSGTTMSIFINGTRAGTATVSNNFSATTNIRVGGPNGVDYFLGYISNARFVKGSSVYDPSQTSITVPTSPLTAITNTKFLTCQNNRFVDNSSTGYAITPNGTPSVQAFSPFAPTAAYSAATVGGSGFFDGSGDYLISGAASVGANNFTIEFWIYPTSFAASSYPLWTTSSGSKTDVIAFEINTAGVLVVYVTQAGGGAAWGIISGGNIGTLTRNAWNHVALVRNGTAWRGYVNGVAGGLNTTSSTTVETFNGFSIGAIPNNSGHITGYIAGLREVVGTAVYTAAFTPPTAPPTAITNTSLLVNYTNAGITDATAKNVLETVGGAQISTTQSKFGGSSMYFDGNGDYLSLPARPVLNVSGGRQFTVECWIYTSSTARQNVCIDTASSQYWDLCIDNLKVNFRYNNAGVSITSSASITSGAWNHIAICWTGSAMRIFINGTMDSANSSTSMTSHADAIMILGYSNYSPDPQWMNGYIDDFRITNGLARYTANFTAPTSAFALQ